jgi:hypothetical protein
MDCAGTRNEQTSARQTPAKRRDFKRDSLVVTAEVERIRRTQTGGRAS